MLTQKVLFVADRDCSNISQAQLKYCVLPHPKSANVVYVVVDGEIFECNNYQPRTHASFFIDQRVCSNDSVLIATKVDPRFLLLPFIAKAVKYSPIDQILTHTAGCDRLVNHISKIGEWRMDEMCDVNDKYDDMILYRHNEDKVLQWLRGKAERCAAVMHVKRTQELRNGNGNAFAKGFNMAGQGKTRENTSIKATHVEDSSAPLYEEEDLRSAALVLCDFLSEEFSAMLFTHLGLGASGSSTTTSESSQNAPLSSNGSGNAASDSINTLGDDSCVQKRKLTSWEAELEMEKETLAYCTGGGGGSGPASGAGQGDANKKLKTASTTAGSVKKPVVAPKGVKSMMSYFGATKASK